MSPKECFTELKLELPRLQFNLTNDLNWQELASVESYLDFYRIHYEEIFTDLYHGFGMVEAAGYHIATHYWLPKSPKGTLVVVHGYYDHVGIFNHAIRFALERNLAVIAFDLPGHGLSSGVPAEIDSFNQYGDVLAEVLRQSQALMPQPLHALGQSTGCAVLMNYLWRYEYAHAVPVFEKMVLCAPLIVARGWGLGKYVYAVVHHFMDRLKRGATTSSHNQQFNDFINNTDPLQAKYLSIKWVGAMKAWNEAFRCFSVLPKEVLIVQGTGDMTVDWRYNVPLIQQKLPNSKLVVIEGAGHQLINESDEYRNQVMVAMNNYFNV